VRGPAKALNTKDLQLSTIILISLTFSYPFIKAGLFMAINVSTDATSLTVNNPLLSTWDGPHELPPFAQLRAEHFVPAFDAALAAHLAEIDALSAQTAAPDFSNTIVSFDQSGRAFQRISQLFYNLTASETSPALQAVERDMAPRLASHSSAIYMHAGLFARIDQLHAQRAHLGLDTEQLRLLERVHLDFTRAGAKLAPDKKIRYAQIMQQLASLTTQFSQNVLAEEASWHLLLQSEEDLAGLPAFVRDAARNAAQERGVAEGWVITLSRSLIVPFLTFSARRDLREKAFTAWTQRGQTPGAHDNRPIVREILQLRNAQARLHGHSCYADYALLDTMAGTQTAVQELLLKVWQPAKERRGPRT
jgi:peptidyl-dipeptidase Dcp